MDKNVRVFSSDRWLYHTSLTAPALLCRAAKAAGGVSGKKASWEVKAVRSDRWVQEYSYQTEQPEPTEQRGKYLHPELYVQPKEMGIHYRPELERVTPPAPVER